MKKQYIQTLFLSVALLSTSLILQGCDNPADSDSDDDRTEETDNNWPVDTTTQVIEVTSPETGRIWMDRNLGAGRAATSSTDAQAFGDLYQWGRAADGHQARTSATTTSTSSTNQPGHGDFIIESTSDWRSGQNANLWQGSDGINNPCPDKFRLPTTEELDAERQSWDSNNATGAFDSPLRFTLSGGRDYDDGSITRAGEFGYYWTSTVDGVVSRIMVFADATAFMDLSRRAQGRSVRCIKD